MYVCGWGWGGWAWSTIATNGSSVGDVWAVWLSVRVISVKDINLKSHQLAV